MRKAISDGYAKREKVPFRFNPQFGRRNKINQLMFNQRSKLRLTLFMLLAFLSAFGASGAEVSLGKDRSGDPVVDIAGKLEKGDFEKIVRTSRELILTQGDSRAKPLRFFLSTPGGDIEEAMRIGRFARETLVEIDSYGKTIVAPGSELEKRLSALDEPPWRRRDYVFLRPEIAISDEHIVKNYSAGILILYGGVRRAFRDNIDERLGFSGRKRIPVIGIHRPYYEKEYYSTLSPTQAAESYKVLERNVRNYLGEMGAPQEIVDRMFSRSSNEIDLLSAEEFRKYIKSEESFFQEWLIAKCGTSGVENVLKGSALEDFRQIEKEQFALTFADKSFLEKLDKPVGYIYPSTIFSQSYVENLYEKVRGYNYSVSVCREKAVSSHQREWAATHK